MSHTKNQKASQKGKSRRKSKGKSRPRQNVSDRQARKITKLLLKRQESSLAGPGGQNWASRNGSFTMYGKVHRD